MGAMAGASADERDAEGLTPLMRAAADGAGRRALRCLAAAGAGLEARDGGARRATALWMAARCGHAEAVEELGRLGADVNAVANPGAMDITPVCAAAGEGFVDVVEALGRLGADVNRARNKGWTPLRIARQEGHSAAAAALERLGAR
jgi:ankyrin repeat protein